MAAVLKLVASLLIVGIAPAIGMMFPADAWYETLRHPPGTPPNATFGIVWPILYLLMAIALWLVWLQPRTVPRQLALLTFVVQLTLNALWSPLFFGLHCPICALVDQLLLLGSLCATIIWFSLHSPLAGRLLAPYLLWTLFATYLIVGVVVLN